MDRIELRSSHLCEDCLVGVSNTVEQYSFLGAGEFVGSLLLGSSLTCPFACAPHLALVAAWGDGWGVSGVPFRGGGTGFGKGNLPSGDLGVLIPLLSMVLGGCPRASKVNE